MFERAGAAVMQKIMENKRAAEALAETVQSGSPIPTTNAPDLSKMKKN
jgi:hypothetical protein